MSRVKVKICGVRTREEALVAAENGADFLGFNFWPRSPRYVAQSAAKEIIETLPETVSTVGVFVDEEKADVIQQARELGLKFVQLHGDEDAEYCAQMHLALSQIDPAIGIIKAFRVGPDFDASALTRFQIDLALLDASVKGYVGGTGRVFNWQIAVKAKSSTPIMLAGGLNAGNIGEAIETVMPAAVGVCTGVEAEPGRKDLARLREFLALVKSLNTSLAESNSGQL